MLMAPHKNYIYKSADHEPDTVSKFLFYSLSPKPKDIQFTEDKLKELHFSINQQLIATMLMMHMIVSALKLM